MKSIIAILIYLLMISLTISGQEKQPEKLLREAIYQEEVNGNLEEAIQIYTDIIDKYPEQRAINAEALYHLGFANEKLGNKKAQEYYETIVSSYEDQPKFVRIAKERLSKLMVVEKIPEILPEPKFRKIRTPFNIPQWSGSRLSPEGKTLAFGSNSIWTVPIPGAVDSELAGEPKELKGGEDVLGDGLSWSGDGQWIAFSRSYVRGGGTRINFNPEGAYIDVIPSSGGEPKRIPVPQWVATKGDTQRRLSLSHDGKMVAFDAGGQIYVASVETGDIKQLTNKGCISPCFSPDGTKIAYLTPRTWQDNLPISPEVWVMSVKGEDPVKVSGNLENQGLINGKGPIWSPDGKMIAFGRRVKGGRCEVCIVTISKQGRPDASPIQIELPLSSTDFVTGWTPDNKIGLLLESNFREDVYTVSVLGGKVTQMSRGGSHPHWSPDGKRIYLRTRNGINSAPSGGGKMRRHSGFIKDEDLGVKYPGGGNSISHDGKSLVFSGWEKSTVGIYTIPAEGGDPKQITNEGQYPCWSPDGKWIAYMAQDIVDDNEPIATIFKIPREGGELIKITSAVDLVTAGGFDWSPDGKWIAYYSKKKKTLSGTLNLIPTDGGESREICRVQHIIPHNEISWSPDGHQIAFTSRGKIWIVSANGGEPVEVKTDVDAFAAMLDWSPDGKKIAFSGNSGGKPEFWFMENFLPLDKLAQKEEVKEPEGITIKQVWTGEKVDDMGQVSKDGNYQSYVDWDSGNLAIHNLKTKENKLLTHEGSWEEPYHYADVSLITNDGKKIIYSWHNDDGDYELRSTDIINSTPKIIYKPKTPEQIFPKLLYSKDKKVIVQRFNPSEVWHLASVNMENGEINNLKNFEGNFEINLSKSPDRKYFAFDFPNKNDESRFDINLLSTDGKEELPLVAHPANDRLLGWLPGNNELLFISDRLGTTDVWALNTSNLASLKDPELILANIGNINPLGFTDNGSLFYSIRMRKFNAFIIPFDENSGKLSMDSKKAIFGSILDPFWINEESMIWCNFATELNTTWKFKLSALNNKTGTKRELAANINVKGAQRLSPDGKSVLFSGLDELRVNDQNYKGGIYSIDINSGIASEIKVLKDVSRSYSVEWDKDGKNVFYTSNRNIIKHNIETGVETVLYEDAHLGIYSSLRRSWDGDHLLFDVQENDTLKYLKSIPVNGGEDRILSSFNTSYTHIMFKKLILSSNGEYIYFSVDDPESESGSILWKISKEGGKKEKLWHSKNKIAGLDIHPTGKQMVISNFSRVKEIRVIENLAQEVKNIYSQNE